MHPADSRFRCSDSASDISYSKGERRESDAIILPAITVKTNNGNNCPANNSVGKRGSLKTSNNSLPVKLESSNSNPNSNHCFLTPIPKDPQKALMRQQSQDTIADARSTMDTDSAENFIVEIDRLHAAVARTDSKRPTLRAIRCVLEHRYCHYCIVGLVVFDVFLVVSSLLVEIRAVEMKCQEHLRRARESETASLENIRSACNETVLQSVVNSNSKLSVNESRVVRDFAAALNATAHIQELLIVMLGAFDFQQLRSLEAIEEWLHFTGLVIICVFVVEVTFKVIAFCPEFFRSKIDVLDMLLVYISFVCELALSISDVRVGVREAVFIAMLLRLWRIARIVSGVVISMKTRYEGEILRLKAKLKAAQNAASPICSNNAPHNTVKQLFYRARHFSEVNFHGLRDKFLQRKMVGRTVDTSNEEEEEEEEERHDDILESSPPVLRHVANLKTKAAEQAPLHRHNSFDASP